MYSNLQAMLVKESENNLAKTDALLQKTTCGAALKTWGIRNLMTDVAHRAVSQATPESSLPEVAYKKMMARATSQQRKTIATYSAKLDAVEAAQFPDVIRVTVEWRRSRTWGLNPLVTVSAGDCVTDGKASGCGYDKESAAVASAMNKNLSILRVWYDHAERGGQFAYSMFGTERGMLPCMDGGCGMSSVIEVFEKLGYKCEQEHGKTFDFYVFNKNSR